MTPPLVSIIVPCFNHGRYVAQALDSVRAQTHPGWECVVVDDGSTDDTRQVGARYAESDARIKYLYQENRGLSAARNSGLDNSAGEYVQFLDADDLIESEKLARQVAYLEGHATVDIVYGGVRYFKDGDAGERRYSMKADDAPWMPGASGSGREMLEVMSHGNIMAVNCPLMRRTVVGTVGYFDTALPLLEDWDYWIRCAAGGVRFQYDDAAGARSLVRYHASSLSADKGRMAEAARRLQKKLRAAASDPQLGRTYKMAAAQIEGSLAVEEVAGGNWAKGLLGLLRAGAASRNPKWFVYALAAPFVSGRQLEKISSFSASRFVAAKRQAKKHR